MKCSFLGQRAGKRDGALSLVPSPLFSEVETPGTPCGGAVLTSSAHREWDRAELPRVLQPRGPHRPWRELSAQVGDKKVRLPLRSQLWFAHRPRLLAGKCFPRVASACLTHVPLNLVSWQTGGGETCGFHFPFPPSTTLILPEPLRRWEGTACWPHPGQQRCWELELAVSSWTGCFPLGTSVSSSLK